MIWKLIPILAQTPPVTPDDLKRGASSARFPTFHLNDMMTIIAVTMVLVLALVGWAVFIRKPKSDTARVRIHKSRSHEEETEDGMIRKRKKHKRPRREHRTRNPTLAEAGGLPPVKADNTPPPI